MASTESPKKTSIADLLAAKLRAPGNLDLRRLPEGIKSAYKNGFIEGYRKTGRNRDDELYCLGYREGAELRAYEEKLFAQESARA